MYSYQTIIKGRNVQHRGLTTYLFFSKTSYILRYIVKYMYFVVQKIYNYKILTYPFTIKSWSDWVFQKTSRFLKGSLSFLMKKIQVFSKKLLFEVKQEYDTKILEREKNLHLLVQCDELQQKNKKDKTHWFNFVWITCITWQHIGCHQYQEV